MFGKKCENCKKKIGKDYEFCPHCGKHTNSLEEDFGLLGKDDLAEAEKDFKLPFGFNKIFNSLVKELDKQFKDLERIEEPNNKSERKFKKSGISISISTSTQGKTPEIKIKSFGNAMPIFDEKKLVKQTQKIQTAPDISTANIKRLTQLPRQEAEATVRRLSNKLIYELSVPGVKSIKDVFIHELENSIEVKAIGEEKSYSKLIPVKFPVKKYTLKEDKLILELDSRE